MFDLDLRPLFTFFLIVGVVIGCGVTIGVSCLRQHVTVHVETK